MTVKVAFRVDACHKTGLGHLNRCLCLAHALAKAGAHCTFFCFASDEQLLSSIRLAGFELHLGHRYVDGGEPTTVDKLKSFAQKDLQIAKKVIGKLTFDWLIIDHYHLDKEWEEVFAGRFKVMVIDDLFDREHQCDVLVDTAIHDNPKRYDSLVPTYCNKLMSPSFALLHEKFGEIRNRQNFDIQRKRRKNNLLISVSGTDPHGWNLKILSRLGMHFELMTEWTFIVPILSSSPNLLALKDLAKSTKLNVIIIQDVADMATLIHACKIAIGAPGVSALERCCLGVPTVAFPVAQNQIPGASGLSKAGVHKFVPSIDDHNFTQAVIDLMAHDKECDAMSKRCMGLVDGQGAIHVSEIILNWYD